ncbi:hypothetical protein ACOI1C_09220 [Bacillus sp. DJP31]|uniref:hypothetical protein n=1 Tax=Bacillus sp. DJP31 TaxID=3409789 RepID=UPI003BB5B844
MFFVIISAVRHLGNLYILPEGIILHGKYYNSNQINCYETEKIHRGHELYGLHDRANNNAYKLTLKVKKKFFQPNYVVIENLIYLEQIILLLDKQGIQGIQKPEPIHSSITNFTHKS